MAKYTKLYETVIHTTVEVEAQDIVQAEWMFNNEQGTIIDVQETHNNLPIEWVEGN